MLTHGGSERSRDRKGAVYSNCENALAPQLFAGQRRAFGERLQLGPANLGMHAHAHAAIRAGDDVLAADQAGV